MKRTRFKPEIKRNQSFALNITSMTDMFTILLVFLLQTFATSEVPMEPVAGLRLPSSQTDKNPVEGIKISLSPTELKMDKTMLAQVKDNAIDKLAIDKNDSNFIRPLFDELQKLNNAKDANKNETAKIGKILLQADQSMPYATIRKVMYTASMAGFPNVKLVTTVGE